MADSGKLNPKYWPSRKWTADGQSRMCATPDDVPPGYADSPQEAALLKKAQQADDTPDFWAPFELTREAAEAKAGELGIKRASAMKDATLAKRLVEALDDVADQKEAACDAEADTELKADVELPDGQRFTAG